LEHQTVISRSLASVRSRALGKRPAILSRLAKILYRRSAGRAAIASAKID
jgi:hypothetical protein